MLIKDTQYQPVDQHPPNLPEQRVEPLHLAERYHLCEEAHDPGLAHNHQVDVVFELLGQVGQFLL